MIKLLTIDKMKLKITDIDVLRYRCIKRES